MNILNEMIWIGKITYFIPHKVSQKRFLGYSGLMLCSIAC
jgi:hypothetical protein